MKGINRVILAGHLGADPELRHTPNGTAVVDLRVASNRNVRRGDEWEEETDWNTVTVWDTQAENVARYLSKGSAVLVEGMLKTDSWEDKETGKTRYKVKVQAQRVHFLSGPRKPADVSPTNGVSEPMTQDDQLPF